MICFNVLQKASPCVQYLMALRSHLLQATILYEETGTESATATASTSAAPSVYHDSLEVRDKFSKIEIEND